MSVVNGSNATNELINNTVIDFYTRKINNFIQHFLYRIHIKGVCGFFGNGI